MSSERCGNCKFYLLDEQELLHESESGAPFFGAQCRRYPPKVVACRLDYDDLDFESQVAEHQFPLVVALWWCGEWKPAAEGEA